MTRKNPIYQRARKTFSGFAVGQVGLENPSLGPQSYRLGADLDFEANAKEGIAVDLAHFATRTYAPWYDYVEEFAGISGPARRLTATA